jgi:protein TonB
VQGGGRRGGIVSRGGAGTTLKTRILFIAALCLSLTIHALVLFIPSLPYSKPASQSETYRVELVQKKVKATAHAEPQSIPVSQTIQEKTKPRQNLTKPIHTDVVKKSEKTPAMDSQLRHKPDPAANSPAELRTVSSTYRQNGWSSSAQRSSIQTQPNDYQRILGELNRLLHEHLRYPETARRKGIEGALAIRFTLNTNGTATDVVVSESSGSHLLDRAAVRAISDIFPYPEPPDTPLHFTIPVTYRLAQSE